MIQVILAILVSLQTYSINYKPVHVLQTEGVTCGASARFMKEAIKIQLGTRRAFVNHDEWEVIDYEQADEELVDIAGLDTNAWGFALKYQVNEDAYMSMNLLFNEREAYLSIQGIDAKRRPCKDAVYLKRTR